MSSFPDGFLMQEIEYRIGHPPPFSDDELRVVTRLTLERVHDFEGLDLLSSLTTVSIERSKARNIQFVKHLGQLETLLIDTTLIEDITALSTQESFLILTLKNSCVRDLSGLQHVREIARLNLQGNPLSKESYFDIVPQLQERLDSVSVDSKDVWRLNCQLRELGLRAAYSSHSDDGHRLVPLTEELQFSQQKLVYAVISPEELASELDKPEVDLADLVERYKPATKKKESIWDKRKRGSAEQAREWIKGADLEEGLEESLLGFVGRFEEASFVREFDELIEYVERSRGPARHDPGWSEFALPEWVKTWRKTLAWAEKSEKPSCFVVQRPDLSSEIEYAGPLEFTLRPMGCENSDFAQALLNRHQAYPIGYAGAQAEWGLTIDVGEGADGRIYICSTERVYQWDFDPYEHVLFDSLAAMFSAVDDLSVGQGCPANMLGDTPPTVEFDLDAHLERGDASQARGWIEQSELAGETTRALQDFVAGFPDLDYVRDTDRSLEYSAVYNQVMLSRWYRLIRKTIGFVEAEGHRVRLLFGDWATMALEPFEWGPAHVTYDMGRKLIRDYDHYPVLTSPHHFLMIRLGDAKDRSVYWSDVDEIDLDEFGPTRRFGSLAQMLDAVTGVQVWHGDVIQRR